VFQGEGIQITNIIFNGDTISLGYFDSGLNNIDMDKGLLLSTGSFNDIANTNDQESSGDAHTISPAVTDMDLLLLADGLVSDVTKIEIEFIPLGDEISFNYVFGSEEYPEWGCPTVEGSFFDAFGLFLSGPGIIGGMGFENDAENLAVLPDGTPITVETVHPTTAECAGSNEEFYNENPIGNHVELDGFVDKMTAKATVVPCQTYKLKIVIGDVGRSATQPSNTNDSVIFLEQSSFSSSSPDAQRVTFNQNGIMQEGCSNGSIQVTLPQSQPVDYPVSFTVGGDAVIGVDYNLSAVGVFTIPANSTVGNLVVSPIEDNDDMEGAETFWIAANINTCAPDTFFFVIEDNSAVQPDLGEDVTICAGDSVQLYSTFSPLPSGDQRFINDTQVDIPNAEINGSGELIIETIKSTVEVTNAIPDVLGPGVIKSVCLTLVHTTAAHLNIFLRAPGGAFINLTTHNGGDHDGYDNVCFVPDPSAELIAMPGEVRNSYDTPFPDDPITGSFQPEGDWSNLWKKGSPTNGTWELIVFDDIPGGFSFGDYIESFEITFNAPFDIEYSYNNTDGLSCIGCANPWAKPTTTTTYELTVADNNGCTRTDEITVSVIDTIRPPVPTCGSMTPNDIVLRWDRSNGATDYEVTFNNSGVWIAGNLADTAHQFTGLDPGQTLDIGLRPIGNCVTKDTFFQCTVIACDPINVTENNTTAPSCTGGTDGTLSVSATSTLGTSFTYTIQDPFMSNTTGNFSGLASGVYEIVVENSGCFGELMVTVPEQPALNTITTKVSDPLCPGSMNGRGRVDVSGGTGTGTFSYLWSNGTTTFGVDNAPEGQLYVTVTDGNGCTAVDSLTFIDPPTITLMTESTQVSCNGAMDGTATVTAMNGVEPYQYIWSASAGSQMTATATNLSGGTYPVIVIDANNCQQTTSIEVLEREAIQGTVIPIDATCDGIDDGEASVTDVLGGAGGFTFLWNDAAMSTTVSITNVAVGDAIVTITDSDGCTEVVSASVQSPPAMTSMITTDPVTCSGGSDGGATITISGGAGGYTYAWSDGGASDNVRNDLTSGENMVTVTDANGCRLIETINVPSQNPIFIDIDSTVVTCFGGDDGTIVLNATGGTGTLSFLWDDPSASTASNLVDLSAGTYRVTVTDGNGCFVVDSIEVTQNEKIELITSSTAIACNGDGDGTASVLVNNGIAVDAYIWDDPSAQTMSSAINLDGGLYEVKVTYNGVCADSAEVTVMEPEALVIVIDKKDIACNGETNGSATAEVSGGTAPYQYVWDDALGQITMTASGLVARTYNVTVTDANDCVATSMVEIIEPSLLRVTNKESSSVVCANTSTGSAFFTPDGGVIPYSYEWSDGMASDSLRMDLLPQKYYITITDASACFVVDSVQIGNKSEIILTTDSTRVTCFGGDDGNAFVTASGGNGGFMYLWNDPLAQTGSNANTLTAGLYEVTVTDALNCTSTAQVEVTQNPRINITGDVVDVSCYKGSDGFADASATGGTGALVYQWNDPMNTMSPTLINVQTGSYLISVTDALDCSDTLRFNIGEPDSLATTFAIDGLLCFGDDIGSIQANVTGGNGGFMYEWDDPMNQTTQTATGLMEGFYTLSVTDSRGCMLTDTVRLVEPAALTIQLDSTDVLCNGAATGAINSTVTGGTPGYTFSYTGGSTDADPFGLLAGQYSVTVTDANGCQIIDNTEISEPTAIVIESMKEDIDCFGNLNGAIDITSSGGVGSYDFNWSSGQNVEDILNLGAGAYTLTVTDDNNCDQTTTITITSPLELQKTVNRTNVACFGEMTGLASVNVSGGTSPYNYEWSNGELTQGISSLSADKYFVTIEDNNGCVTIDSTTIAQPAEGLSAMPMAMDLNCFGDANGTIDLDVMGGTAPYQFQLNGQAISNNPIFQGLSGGTYDIEIIDQNGCVLSVSDIMVFEPEEILVSLGDNKIIELGIDTVQLLPQVSGGQGGLFYEYSGNNLDNLTCTDCPDPFIQGQVFTKEYNLTVTDAAGCSNSDNIIVIISKDRRVWVPTGFNPNSISNSNILTPLGDPNTTVINFQIFDRWGTLIYDQSEFQLGDPNVGWDGTYKGKALDTGVFVWKADVVYFEDGVRETFTGQTYLLR